MDNYKKFENDFVDAVYKAYDENDVKYNANNRDFETVFCDYCNLLFTKFVENKKREVLISQELKEKMRKNNKVKKLIKYMKSIIENGDDINNHLTRTIYNSQFDDMLFNDWNIRHIHLNEQEETTNQGMKNNRSNLLLFAIFEDDKCYFIDVRDHNESNLWGLIKFLEILQHNWGNKFFNKVSDGPEQMSIASDEDVLKLRNSSVKANVMIYKLKGKNYIKNYLTGYNVVGKNLYSQMQAMKRIRKYESIQGNYINLKFNYMNYHDLGSIYTSNGELSL